MRSPLACMLVTVLLASSGAAAQGKFEGEVVYRISGPKARSGEMRFYQQRDRLRQEYEMGALTGAIIYDPASGDMLMLVPQRKQYMTLNLKAMGEQIGRSMPGSHEAPDLSKMKVTPTGQRETIAGVPCEHYLFVRPDADAHGRLDICGARGMGFLATTQGMAQMPSTAALLRANNPQLAKLAHDGFFPLKLTMTPEGGEPMSWEATRVDRRHLDAALFAPPAGYTKMTMPGRGGAPPKP